MRHLTPAILTCALSLLHQVEAAGPRVGMDEVSRVYYAMVYAKPLPADFEEDLNEVLKESGIPHQDYIDHIVEEIGAFTGFDESYNNFNDCCKRSARAAGFGLQLYPGNAAIEERTLDYLTWLVAEDPGHSSGVLELIKSNGSMELQEEVGSALMGNPTLPDEIVTAWVAGLKEDSSDFHRAPEGSIFTDKFLHKKQQASLILLLISAGLLWMQQRMQVADLRARASH